MRWYLIRTWKGKEMEIMEEIRRAVPSSMYRECFVISQERIWRKQKKSVVHIEKMFPGCVFLTCKEGKALASQLEMVPAMAQRMACGDLTVLPLMKTDVDFLTTISGADHVARLSYVKKDEKGQVCLISGPLLSCAGQVERYQFKKRYAMVRRRMWGEDRAIVLGIVLKEDVEEVLYLSV